MVAPDNQEEQTAQREILKTVDTLPEGLRDVVILVCWQGMTHAEAAEVLDILAKLNVKLDNPAQPV